MSVQDDLLHTLIEYGVPVCLALFVSYQISSTMTQVGYPPQQAVEFQWIGFFACLLIFYGALKVYLHLRGSFQLSR